MALRPSSLPPPLPPPARSGEADVQHEVSQPHVEYAAAGPVHDGSQRDDGQDYHDHPEEEHNDAGDSTPGYGPRSSHGHQLPAIVRPIRRTTSAAFSRRTQTAEPGT